MTDAALASSDLLFAGVVFPSKVYGNRAGGRPLVWLRPGMGVEELRAGANEVDPPLRPKLRKILDNWRVIVERPGGAIRIAAVLNQG